MKRFLASLLSLALVFTSGGVAEAAIAAPDALAIPSDLPQFRLQPPGKLGRVTDYFNASGPRGVGASEKQPLIVLIQDLHAHYGVQKNISGILEFLNDKLSTPAPRHTDSPAPAFAIGVEGASLPIDHTILAKFPDRKVAEAAADFLMKEAEITGAEYFAVKQQQPKLLVGVENAEYYNVHREVFTKTYADRELLVRELKTIQAQIDRLPRKLYTRPLIQIHRLEKTHHAGKISTQEFVARLLSFGGKDVLKEFPTLARFTTNAGVIFTPDQMRAVVGAFLQSAYPLFTGQERKNLEILGKGQEAHPYFLYLRELIHKHKLFLAVPMELAQHLEYIHTVESMGMDRVLFEAKELAFRVKLQLASETPSRPLAPSPLRDLIQVQHDIDLLLRLADLKATENEVRAFGPRFNAFLAMTKTLIKENIEEKKLQRLISSSIDYYALAMMRNQPMVENTLALIQPTKSSSVAVLVAGGFHTDPITQLLRQKNISYLVITPMVDQLTDLDHDLYVNRLMGNHLTNAEILAKGSVFNRQNSALKLAMGKFRNLLPKKEKDAALQMVLDRPLMVGSIVALTALAAGIYNWGPDQAYSWVRDQSQALSYQVAGFADLFIKHPTVESLSLAGAVALPVPASRSTNEALKEFLSNPNEVNKVWRTIMARTGNTEVADEILQETYARVLNSKVEFRHDSTMSTYLIKAAMNVINENARYREVRNRYAAGSPDEGPDHASHQIRSRDPLPDEQLLIKEKKDQITAAISTLKPRDQEILRRRFMEGDSVSKVAEDLGTPEATIKTRTFRALAKIKEYLNLSDKSSNDLQLNPGIILNLKNLFLKLPGTQKLAPFYDDLIGPALEELLFTALPLLAGGLPLLILARMLFIALHLNGSQAPPAPGQQELTLFEKLLIPTVVSLASIGLAFSAGSQLTTNAMLALTGKSALWHSIANVVTPNLNQIVNKQFQKARLSPYDKTSLWRQPKLRWDDFEEIGPVKSNVIYTHSMKEIRHGPTGEIFLLKSAPEHTIRSEFIGSRIFRAAGLPAPRTRLMNHNGKTYLLMERLTGYKETKFVSLPKGYESHPTLQDGLLLDLLLYNYDRTAWNILYKPDQNKLANIDFGASLFSRAQGGMKGYPTTFDPAEMNVVALENPQFAGHPVNEAYKNALTPGSLAIANSLFRLESLTENQIDAIVEEAYAGLTQENTRSTLLKRQAGYIEESPRFYSARDTFARILTEWDGDEKAYLKVAIKARRNAIIAHYKPRTPPASKNLLPAGKEPLLLEAGKQPLLLAAPENGIAIAPSDAETPAVEKITKTNPPSNGMDVTNAYLKGMKTPTQMTDVPLLMKQAYDHMTKLRNDFPNHINQLNKALTEIAAFRNSLGFQRFLVVARVMAAVVGKVHKQDPDRFIVHFARDMAFNMAVQESLQSLEKNGSGSKGSALYLNRGMMGSVYEELRGLLVLMEHHRGDFADASERWFAERMASGDPAFIALAETTRDSLQEKGMFSHDKVLLMDTGFIGTMPWYVHALIHYYDKQEGRPQRDVEILLVRSENRTREFSADDVTPEDKSLLGKAPGLFKMLTQNATMLGQLEALGDNRMHPVIFREHSAEIVPEDPGNQLQFFFIRSIFINMAIAQHNQELGVEELKAAGIKVDDLPDFAFPPEPGTKSRHINIEKLGLIYNDILKIDTTIAEYTKTPPIPKGLKLPNANTLPKVFFKESEIPPAAKKDDLSTIAKAVSTDILWAKNLLASKDNWRHIAKQYLDKQVPKMTLPNAKLKWDPFYVVKKAEDAIKKQALLDIKKFDAFFEDLKHFKKHQALVKVTKHLRLWVRLTAFPKNNPYGLTAAIIGGLSGILLTLAYLLGGMDGATYTSSLLSALFGTAGLFSASWGYRQYLKAIHEGQFVQASLSETETLAAVRDQLIELYPESDGLAGITIVDRIEAMTDEHAEHSHRSYFYDVSARTIYVNTHQKERAINPVNNALYDSHLKRLFVLRQVAESTPFERGLTLSHEVGKRVFAETDIDLGRWQPYLAEFIGNLYELAYALGLPIRITPQRLREILIPFIRTLSVLRIQVNYLMNNFITFDANAATLPILVSDVLFKNQTEHVEKFVLTKTESIHWPSVGLAGIVTFIPLLLFSLLHADVDPTGPYVIIGIGIWGSLYMIFDSLFGARRETSKLIPQTPVPVVVHIPTPLRKLVDNIHSISVEARSPEEAIREIARMFPRLANEIFTPGSEDFHPSIQIMVNEGTLEAWKQLYYPLRSTDEITIVPNIAGEVDIDRATTSRVTQSPTLMVAVLGALLTAWAAQTFGHETVELANTQTAGFSGSMLQNILYAGLASSGLLELWHSIRSPRAPPVAARAELFRGVLRPDGSDTQRRLNEDQLAYFRMLFPALVSIFLPQAPSWSEFRQSVRYLRDDLLYWLNYEWTVTISVKQIIRALIIAGLLAWGLYQSNDVVPQPTEDQIEEQLQRPLNDSDPATRRFADVYIPGFLKAQFPGAKTVSVQAGTGHELIEALIAKGQIPRKVFYTDQGKARVVLFNADGERISLNARLEKSGPIEVVADVSGAADEPMGSTLQESNPTYENDVEKHLALAEKAIAEGNFAESFELFKHAIALYGVADADYVPAGQTYPERIENPEQVYSILRALRPHFQDPAFNAIYNQIYQARTADKPLSLKAVSMLLRAYGHIPVLPLPAKAAYDQEPFANNQKVVRDSAEPAIFEMPFSKVRISIDGTTDYQFDIDIHGRSVVQFFDNEKGTPMGPAQIIEPGLLINSRSGGPERVGRFSHHDPHTMRFMVTQNEENQFVLTLGFEHSATVRWNAPSAETQSRTYGDLQEIYESIPIFYARVSPYYQRPLIGSTISTLERDYANLLGRWSVLRDFESLEADAAALKARALAFQQEMRRETERHDRYVARFPPLQEKINDLNRTIRSLLATNESIFKKAYFDEKIIIPNLHRQIDSAHELLRKAGLSGDAIDYKALDALLNKLQTQIQEDTDRIGAFVAEAARRKEAGQSGGRTPRVSESKLDKAFALTGLKRGISLQDAQKARRQAIRALFVAGQHEDLFEASDPRKEAAHKHMAELLAAFDDVFSVAPNVPNGANTATDLVHNSTYEAAMVRYGLGRRALNQWVNETSENRAIILEKAIQKISDDQWLPLRATSGEQIKEQLIRMASTNPRAKTLLTYIRQDFAPKFEDPNFIDLETALAFVNTHTISDNDIARIQHRYPGMTPNEIRAAIHRTQSFAAKAIVYSAIGKASWAIPIGIGIPLLLNVIAVGLASFGFIDLPLSITTDEGIRLYAAAFLSIYAGGIAGQVLLPARLERWARSREHRLWNSDEETIQDGKELSYTGPTSSKIIDLLEGESKDLQPGETEPHTAMAFCAGSGVIAVIQTKSNSRSALFNVGWDTLINEEKIAKTLSNWPNEPVTVTLYWEIRHNPDSSANKQFQIMAAFQRVFEKRQVRAQFNRKGLEGDHYIIVRGSHGPQPSLQVLQGNEITRTPALKAASETLHRRLRGSGRDTKKPRRSILPQNKLNHGPLNPAHLKNLAKTLADPTIELNLELQNLLNALEQRNPGAATTAIQQFNFLFAMVSTKKSDLAGEAGESPSTEFQVLFQSIELYFGNTLSGIQLLLETKNDKALATAQSELKELIAGLRNLADNPAQLVIEDQWGYLNFRAMANAIAPREPTLYQDLVAGTLPDAARSMAATNKPLHKAIERFAGAVEKATEPADLQNAADQFQKAFNAVLLNADEGTPRFLADSILNALNEILTRTGNPQVRGIPYSEAKSTTQEEIRTVKRWMDVLRQLRSADVKVDANGLLDLPGMAAASISVPTRRILLSALGALIGKMLFTATPKAKAQELPPTGLPKLTSLKGAVDQMMKTIIEPGKVVSYHLNVDGVPPVLLMQTGDVETMIRMMSRYFALNDQPGLTQQLLIDGRRENSVDFMYRRIRELRPQDVKTDPWAAHYSLQQIVMAWNMYAFAARNGQLSMTLDLDEMAFMAHLEALGWISKSQVKDEEIPVFQVSVDQGMNASVVVMPGMHKLRPNAAAGGFSHEMAHVALDSNTDLFNDVKALWDSLKEEYRVAFTKQYDNLIDITNASYIAQRNRIHEFAALGRDAYGYRKDYFKDFPLSEILRIQNAIRALEKKHVPWLVPLQYAWPVPVNIRIPVQMRTTFDKKDVIALTARTPRDVFEQLIKLGNLPRTSLFDGEKPKANLFDAQGNMLSLDAPLPGGTLSLLPNIAGEVDDTKSIPLQRFALPLLVFAFGIVTAYAYHFFGVDLATLQSHLAGTDLAALPLLSIPSLMKENGTPPSMHDHHGLALVQESPDKRNKKEGPHQNPRFLHLRLPETAAVVASNRKLLNTKDLKSLDYKAPYVRAGYIDGYIDGFGRIVSLEEEDTYEALLHQHGNVWPFSVAVIERPIQRERVFGRLLIMKSEDAFHHSYLPDIAAQRMRKTFDDEADVAEDRTTPLNLRFMLGLNPGQAQGTLPLEVKASRQGLEVAVTSSMNPKRYAFAPANDVVYHVGSNLSGNSPEKPDYLAGQVTSRTTISWNQIEFRFHHGEWEIRNRSKHKTAIVIRRKLVTVSFDWTPLSTLAETPINHAEEMAFRFQQLALDAAQNHNVILKLGQPLTSDVLEQAEIIMEAIREMSSLSRKAASPLKLVLASIKEDSIMGKAHIDRPDRFAEIGLTQFYEMYPDDPAERRRHIKRVATHELLHLYALSLARKQRPDERTKLNVPIEDWIDLFRLHGLVTVRQEVRNGAYIATPLEDYLRKIAQMEGLEAVAMAIASLRGKDITTDNGTPYPMDPHEIFAHHAIGNFPGFGLAGKALKTLQILHRNALKTVFGRLQYSFKHAQWTLLTDDEDTRLLVDKSIEFGPLGDIIGRSLSFQSPAAMVVSSAMWHWMMLKRAQARDHWTKRLDAQEITMLGTLWAMVAEWFVMISVGLSIAGVTALASLAIPAMALIWITIVIAETHFERELFQIRNNRSMTSRETWSLVWPKLVAGLAYVPFAMTLAQESKSLPLAVAFAALAHPLRDFIVMLNATPDTAAAARPTPSETAIPFLDVEPDAIDTLFTLSNKYFYAEEFYKADDVIHAIQRLMKEHHMLAVYLRLLPFIGQHESELKKALFLAITQVVRDLQPTRPVITLESAQEAYRDHLLENLQSERFMVLIKKALRDQNVPEEAMQAPVAMKEETPRPGKASMEQVDVLMDQLHIVTADNPNPVAPSIEIDTLIPHRILRNGPASKARDQKHVIPLLNAIADIQIGMWEGNDAIFVFREPSGTDDEEKTKRELVAASLNVESPLVGAGEFDSAKKGQMSRHVKNALVLWWNNRALFASQYPLADAFLTAHSVPTTEDAISDSALRVRESPNTSTTIEEFAFFTNIDRWWKTPLFLLAIPHELGHAYRAWRGGFKIVGWRLWGKTYIQIARWNDQDFEALSREDKASRFDTLVKLARGGAEGNFATILATLAIAELVSWLFSLSPNFNWPTLLGGGLFLGGQLATGLVSLFANTLDRQQLDYFTYHRDRHLDHVRHYQSGMDVFRGLSLPQVFHLLKQRELRLKDIRDREADSLDLTVSGTSLETMRDIGKMERAGQLTAGQRRAILAEAKAQGLWNAKYNKDKGIFQDDTVNKEPKRPKSVTRFENPTQNVRKPVDLLLKKVVAGDADIDRGDANALFAQQKGLSDSARYLAVSDITPADLPYESHGLRPVNPTVQLLNLKVEEANAEGPVFLVSRTKSGTQASVRLGVISDTQRPVALVSYPIQLNQSLEDHDLIIEKQIRAAKAGDAIGALRFHGSTTDRYGDTVLVYDIVPGDNPMVAARNGGINADTLLEFIDLQKRLMTNGLHDQDLQLHIDHDGHIGLIDPDTLTNSTGDLASYKSHDFNKRLDFLLRAIMRDGDNSVVAALARLSKSQDGPVILRSLENWLKDNAREGDQHRLQGLLDRGTTPRAAKRWTFSSLLGDWMSAALLTVLSVRWLRDTLLHNSADVLVGVGLSVAAIAVFTLWRYRTRLMNWFNSLRGIPMDMQTLHNMAVAGKDLGFDRYDSSVRNKHEGAVRKTANALMTFASQA